MGFVLGPNQYGKAENRVVRIYRDTDAARDPRPQCHDRAARRLRRRARRRRPVARAPHGHPEEHRVRLRQAVRGHLARGVRPRPRRAAAGGDARGDRRPGRRSRSSPGTGSRSPAPGTTTRSCVAVARSAPPWSTSRPRGGLLVVSGFHDLVVLKSTGSEFKGFLREEYTTLPDADDRILATSLTARWRHIRTPRGRRLGRRRTAVRATCSRPSPATYSRALQETLYAMGAAVLEAHAAPGRDRRSPRPTSTTSSSTCRRSASTTTARSSSRPTAPTA